MFCVREIEWCYFYAACDAVCTSVFLDRWRARLFHQTKSCTHIIDLTFINSILIEVLITDGKPRYHSTFHLIDSSWTFIFGIYHSTFIFMSDFHGIKFGINIKSKNLTLNILKSFTFNSCIWWTFHICFMMI